MWSRALGTGTSENPTVISDDDDVVFVRRKRLRTQPLNQDPIVISDDDDVVFDNQKQLRTHPIKHEPIKHEPTKHEPTKHESTKHDAFIKQDPFIFGRADSTSQYEDQEKVQQRWTTGIDDD